MNAHSRKRFLIPILLFLLALGIRLIYLNQLRTAPDFDDPIVDADYNDRWAVAISQGTTFQEGPFFRAPLYPYFLALIYAIFGHSYLTARTIQLLIGAGSAVLVYLLGRRVFGTGAGAVAGTLAAIYGTIIFFEGELLIPALILFLDLILLLAVLSAEERSRWWRWLICGFILGLSAIARPNVLVFGVALIPWMSLRLRHRGWGLRGILTSLVAYLVGAILVIAPVAARNYAISRDFVPIASQGGMNFYMGNNPQSDGVTAIIPGARDDFWGGYEDARRMAQVAEGRDLKPSEVSNFWFKRGLSFWKENPGSALRLTLKKMALFWGGAEVANNKDIYFLRHRIPLLKILIWPGPLYLPFGVIAPLALAGMILAWRERKNGRAGLVALFIFSYMASIVPFFVTARFRLPVIPMLLPFAAYGLLSLFRSRSAGKITLSLTLMVFFGLLVNLNLAGYPLPSASTSYVSMGHLYLEKGLYERAREEFRQALAIEAQQTKLTSPRLHAITGLARVDAQTGHIDQAIDRLQDALSRWPQAAGLHFQLGHLYYVQGRLDEAIERWRRTVQLDSTVHQAHLELGIAYEDQGRFDQAIESYQRAIRINPHYALAVYNLGLLYTRIGNFPEAIRQYRRVIQVDPEFADAYAGLAWILAKNEVQQGEGFQLIEKALQLNPNDNWYQDVLAQLYISRGEIEEAKEIFREMIRREPENPYWRERQEGIEK